MVTNGAIIGISAIRFFDAGKFGPADIPYEMQGYLRMAHVLFVEGKCSEIGCTAQMVGVVGNAIFSDGGRCVVGWACVLLLVAWRI